MTEYQKIVINVETGEQWSEPVEADIAATMKAEALRLASLPSEEEIKTAKEAAKAAAEAKLAALGLTADDLKALGLGGN